MAKVRLEVRGTTREHFEAAVRIAFANAPEGKATHYISPLPDRVCSECCGTGKRMHWKTDPERTMCEYVCARCDGRGTLEGSPAIVLLYDSGRIGDVPSMPLPTPLNGDAAVELLWGYLPDSGGFVVTTGDFLGNVEHCKYAFVGVYPARGYRAAAQDAEAVCGRKESEIYADSV